MDIIYGHRKATGGASGYLTIDLGALRDNYLFLQNHAPQSVAGAVVKANAYGLGAALVAPVLYEAGCRHFFVAHIDEAVSLRSRIADDAKIFVLNGLQPGNEACCAALNIMPVLNSLEQIGQWSATAAALGRILPAALQIDTGMSRLGLAPDEVERLEATPSMLQGIELAYIMSHLACADEPQRKENEDQHLTMRKMAALFPHVPVSFANSGGIFLGADFRHALMRPGIALYGGAPSPGVPNPMKAVVALSVAVIQTRTVPAGSFVGYGASLRTNEETRLATIAAGYADGLPRSLGGRGAAYFNGTRLPIAGRVSMDSITLDISALPQGTLKGGSLVEIIGPHQSLEALAEDAGTIAYEILTGLGGRYRRSYVQPSPPLSTVEDTMKDK